MKLLDRIRQFYALSHVVGVSLRLVDESEILVHSCTLTLKNQEISIDTEQDFSDLKSFSSKLQDGIPVALHVEGRGVLIKEVAKNNTTVWDESCILSVFPNFDSSKYYYSYLDSGDKYWISLIKRENIDVIVKELIDYGINIVHLYIGPFVLDPILKQINNYSLMYSFGNHAVTLNDERQWLEYSYHPAHQSKFKTKVGDQLINQQYITSYAAAFNTLMFDYLADISTPMSIISNNYEDSLGKLTFRNNSVILLAFVFVSLIISSVAYSYYFSENERLNTLQTQNTASITNENEWSDVITKKEEILQSLGWNGGVNKSWLLDQIGTSLNEHPAIKLTYIAINPLIKKTQFDSSIGGVDNRDKILIKGRCLSLNNLNRWTRQLSHKSWVDRVIINQFTAAEDVEDTMNAFSIELIFTYEF